MESQGFAPLVNFGSKKHRVLIPLLLLAYALAQGAQSRNLWDRFMPSPVQTEVPKLATRYPTGTPNQLGSNRYLYNITSQYNCDAHNILTIFISGNPNYCNPWYTTEHQPADIPATQYTPRSKHKRKKKKD